MNQTVNSTSYSFVQQGSSRVNLTAKPATATTDNRISASPYRVVARREIVQTGLAKSPSRKTINFNYTNASPYKEHVNPQPRTVSSRSQSVQIISVEDKTKKAQSTMYLTQGATVAQSPHNSTIHIPQHPPQLVHHNPTQINQLNPHAPSHVQQPQTQPSQNHSQNSRTISPSDSKPNSKIMSSQKKNAIDQIINNCAILNSRIQDENIRLNQAKHNGTTCLKANHGISVNLTNWPTKPDSKSTVQQVTNGQIMTELFCINNDNKKAKYRSQQNPNQVYCSKCSIILVGKGIKIVDIEPEKVSSQVVHQQQQTSHISVLIPSHIPETQTPRSGEAHREAELKYFNSSVSHLKQDLLKNLNGIEKQRQQLLSRSKQQKDLIMKSYEQLFTALKEYENKDLNRVLYYQEQCFRHLQTYQTEFKQSTSRLDLIQKDILPNINMIKTQIQEPQYRAFLNDYRKQLKQITQKLEIYTKNVSCSAKPEVLKKDITKLSYDIISLIDYPIGFNKNSLYFSFEAKNSGSSNSTQKTNTILVEDYADSTSLTLSQSGSVGDSAPVSPPFRALFNDDLQEGGDCTASPSFKKL